MVLDSSPEGGREEEEGWTLRSSQSGRSWCLLSSNLKATFRMGTCDGETIMPRGYDETPIPLSPTLTYLPLGAFLNPRCQRYLTAGTLGGRDMTSAPPPEDGDDDVGRGGGGGRLGGEGERRSTTHEVFWARHSPPPSSSSALATWTRINSHFK